MSPDPSAPRRTLTDWLPILRWAPRYTRAHAGGDLMAAAVVTLMLIPQSLAYAQLAGMPPQTGLYASILPLVAYALMGTSSALSVGPAAVTSLMTAAALGPLMSAGSPNHIAAAALLAVMSGVMLLLMGALRLGFLASFLSHPVLSGFVSAAGVLIAASQLKHLLGIPLEGQTLPQLLPSLWQHATQVHGLTLAVGLGSLLLLWGARQGLKPWLQRRGLSARAADLATKAAPVMVLVASTAAAWAWGLETHGLKVVGEIPAGLPPLSLPLPEGPLLEMLGPLASAALLLSLVGFVESVSIGQSLAAKRRERIEPDAELRALGASNVAAGVCGGFPVTGGFSRSAVNFDTGSRTPACGLFTALALLLSAPLVIPMLTHLPQATLAATIVVAVLSLVDIGAFRRTWRYAREDGAALLLSFSVTLVWGVEAGLLAGVSASLLFHLWRTSRPHIATVGQMPGTPHYRNVLRHPVITQPHVLSLRVDESLYFANTRFLEDHLAQQVAAQPDLAHVVLQCTAINAIDSSALESLEAITQRLKDAGVQLHLSEVKGPVMDRLKHSDFLQHLTGQVYLSHHDAVSALAPPVSNAAPGHAISPSREPR